MTVHIKQLKGGADVLEQVEFVRDNLHDYVYVEDSCIVFNIPIKVLNTPKLMNQYESALNGELSDLEAGDDPELLSLYPTAKFYEETIKNLITRIGTTEGNINTLTDQISQNKGSKVSATAASATGTEVGTITVDGTNVVFKVDLSSYAPKASPALSGNPTAPTQTAGNNSTRIATTAFVTTAINNIKGTVADNLNTLQKIAAAINNNPTYYSTVNTALDNKVNKGDISITGSTTTATEAVQIGSIIYNGNTYNFKIDLSAYAPLASPSLTGTPTAPTAIAGTKTTQIATTAFVDNAVTALKGTATADYNTLGKIETAVKANADSIGSINTALGNKQNASTALTQISTLASAANKMIYSTAKNSYAATDLTAFARQSLLSAADAATARTRLDVPSRSGANASGSWNISVTAATKAVNDSNGDPISTTYLKIADHQNPDLSNYVTKVTGKGLSTNDYTTDEKNKLAGIATEATKDTIMSAATSTTAGAAGLVPAPAAGKQTSFLRGDGTWVVPTDTNNATAQNVSTVNNTYPVLLGYTANATSNIGNKAALFSSAVKVNPSLGSVVANKFVGPLEGTATKAVQDSLGNQIDTTYETKANAVTGLSVSGRTITITKGNGSTSTITTQDNDTHYTTHAYVGASGATVNSAQSNNNVYLNITDNTTNRAKFNIKGTGATGVTSDANGNIIINSTNTTYSVATTTANGLMSATDKTKLDGIANVLQYKGTVANFASLPTTGLAVGYVYNITAAGGTDDNGVAVKAGDNVAYNGSGWDVLSGTVDLSNYVTKSNTMTGATSSAAGTAGLVPVPAAGKQGYFLRGDGTWAAPANTTYPAATTSANGLMSAADKTALDNVPSTYETKANAITGLSVSGKVITYTKGNGSTGTITTQDTNTTYKVASSTNITINGTLVPSVASGTTNKYLRSDGTWQVPPNDNTHYTTKAIIGASNGTANAATTNGNTYLRIFDDSTARATFKITGSGAAAVTSDSSGNITINSTNTTYPNMTGATTAAGGAAGLVPAPTSAQSAQFLRGDGTWQTPTNTDTHWTTKAIIGASNGTANAATTNGNTYLRIFDNNTARATFKITGTGATGVSSDASGNITITSTNTTYPNMSAATSAAAGAAGLVPAPAAGKQTSFLRGDGTWVVPTNTDTKYTAGTGLSLSGTTFSANSSYLGSIQKGSSTTTYLRNDGSWATPTNTTYAVMTGATTAQGGAAGLVPAPTTAQSAMYLCGNGTWATPTNTDTHWTTKAIVGASNGTANAATTNGNTYLRIFDNSSARATFKISGTGATSVTSDASGNIVINSTDTNTNTTYTAGTGLSLSGTTFSANSGYLGSIAKGTGTTTYLRNDGSWATPTNTTYAVATQSANGLMSAADKKIVDNLSSTYLGKTAKAASATTADSATTANKLGTSSVGDLTRPIYLNAGTATAVSSALKSCHAVVESEAVTNNIFKIASGVTNGAYDGVNIIILIQNIMGVNAAIWRISLNVGATTGVFSSGTSTLTDNVGLSPEKFIVAYKSNSGSNLQYELYAKVDARYSGYRFTVLQECSRNGRALGQLTLTSHLTTSGTSTITSGFTALTTTNGTVNTNINGTATKLATGKTLKVSLSSTAASTAFDGSADIANIGVAGILPVANGGTGANALTSITVGKANSLTSARALQVSLSSTGAPTFNGTTDVKNIGVTGVLPVANGGTGANTAALARNALGLGNTTGALPIANGGTGATTAAAARTNLGLGSMATETASNYLTKTTNVSEMGRYIDMHYDNATSKYDYDIRMQVNSQGTVAGGGVLQIVGSAVKATKFEGPLTGNVTGNCSGSSGSCTGLSAKATGDKNGNDITTTYVNLTGAQSISGAKTFTGATVIYSKSNVKPSQGQGLYICGADANEGGQINLCAPDSGPTYNGINIDNYQGNLRIIGIPSADGSTRTGGGSTLYINPYTKTITGGYTFTGNVTGNCSGSSGSCTGNAVTANLLRPGKIGNGAFTDAVQVLASDTGHRVATIRVTNGNGFNNITLGVHDESNNAPGGVSITNTNGTYTVALPGTTTGTFQGNLTGNVTGNVSGSCTGNAATATKFASAQTITLTGDVTGSVSSQAGWTINTKRRTCIVGQSGTGGLDKPWYKVASCNIPVDGTRLAITFLVQYQDSSGRNGILRVITTKESGKLEICSATWLLNNGINENDFVMVNPSSGYSPELWVNIHNNYARYFFTVLSDISNVDIGQNWTLYPAITVGQSASVTTAGTQITSTLADIKNEAATVQNSTTGYANITSAADVSIKSASISNFDIRSGSTLMFAVANTGTSTDTTAIIFSITGYNNKIASSNLYLAPSTKCKNSEFKKGYWMATWNGSNWLCTSHPS